MTCGDSITGCRLSRSGRAHRSMSSIQRSWRRPSPREELCTLDQFRSTLDAKHTTWIAVDDGRVIGGLVGEWDEELRVVLLGWLAHPTGYPGRRRRRSTSRHCVDGLARRVHAVPGARRGGGPGEAQRQWPDRRPVRPAAFLPAARRTRAGPALYFQASLGPGLARVPDLLLMVLHVDPQFHGGRPDTVDPTVLRRYLESYQQMRGRGGHRRSGQRGVGGAGRTPGRGTAAGALSRTGVKASVPPSERIDRDAPISAKC